MKKKNKLLLINPVDEYREGFTRSKITRYPPLAFGIISALTPDNWEVEIIDENFDEFKFKEADLVGLTGFTASIYRAYMIGKEYLEKDIPVVIGGIHVSMLPEEAANYANSVVIGEVESCWAELINDFENGEMKKVYKGEKLSLDNIPQIDFSIFHPDYYVGSTLTTRGCPFDCEFCTVTSFNGGKYRMRPVENVLDEIEKIPQERFFFIDDNIIGYSKASKRHAAAIFQGMIDRGIKKQWWSQASLNFAEDEDLLKLAYDSGCRLIFLGIEAETVEGLQVTNKTLNAKVGPDKYSTAFDKIKAAGISVLGSFIFGLDTDSEQDLINRKDFILNSSADCYQTGILTPLPGTRTYKRMEEEGRIIRTNYPEDWQYYSVIDVTFKPNNMSPEKLKEVMDNNWLELYDKKTITRKFIKTLRGTKDIQSSTWAVSTNMSYRNIMHELFGSKELFTIEDLIGPFENAFGKEKK